MGSLGTATRAIWNLPPDRTAAYRSPDFREVSNRVIAHASSVLQVAGFTQFSATMPLLRFLEDRQQVGMFLGLILDMILAILLLLSLLLLHSLLMTAAERRLPVVRTLRVAGLTRAQVVLLVLLQVTLTTVPAWALGLLLAQLGCSFLWGFFSCATHRELLINKTLQKSHCRSIPGTVELPAFLSSTALWKTGTLVLVVVGHSRACCCRYCCFVCDEHNAETHHRRSRPPSCLPVSC